MRRANLKYIVFSIIACIFVIGASTQAVSAASGSVSISGGGNANVGDTVNITVNFNADETLDDLSYGINYDPNVLEFVSGNGATGGNGTVNVSVALSASSGSNSVKFKAINSGNSNISVSNAIGVGSSSDGFQMQSSGARMVSVGASSTTSRDNSLKSLSLSPGTLSPSFSKHNTRYSASVPNTTTKLAVSAVPSNSNAEVISVSGANSLSVGSNNVSVVVEAEDGSRATYTITVTRDSEPAPNETPEATEPPETQEPEPTPTPTPVPEVLPLEVEDESGRKLIINSDFQESRLPESFEKIETRYNGQEISVGQSTSGDLILYYLTDLDGENGGFYIYDEINDIFIEYRELEGRSGKYIILPADKSITIPENFLETTFTIEGKEIKGWQLKGLEDEEFYIVYAMDNRDIKDFYNYDTEGATFQRFSIDAMNTLLGGDSDEDSQVLQNNLGILQEDLDKSKEELSSLQDQYDTDMQGRLMIIIALIILAVILVIALINIFLKNRFLKADLAELEGFREDDDLYDEYDDVTEEFAATEEMELETPSDSPNAIDNHEKPAKDENQDSIEDDFFEDDYEDDYTEENPIEDTFPEETPLEEDAEEVKAEMEENQEKEKKKQKDKKEDIDLENASLEDIFDFLDLDEVDDEE